MSNSKDISDTLAVIREKAAEWRNLGENPNYLSWEDVSAAMNEMIPATNPPKTESEYVDTYYEMDPKTEDVLIGHDLKNGMKVLIESVARRADFSMQLTQEQVELARRSNRWCTVTNLQVDMRSFTFIGLYEDGVKKRRGGDPWDTWIVKLDSIPGPKNYQDVLELVRSGMLDESDEAESHAQKIARSICMLFEE